MSIAFWNDTIDTEQTGLELGTLARRAAWWGGTALGAVILNAGAIFALLYWFSIIE